MKNIKQKAFTLVELLVVITILAILSVVAYQSFGGATDKANNVTKKANITTLGNTLQVFQTDKHYYPMPQAKSITNVWGYNSSVLSIKSNKIEVLYSDQEIKNIVSATGGGYIKGATTGTISDKQIGAKGVIGSNGSFNKKFLKKDIYDTQIGDIKIKDTDLTTVGDQNGKMIDFGIGKYTYAVYARANDIGSWNQGASTGGKYYELATTLTDTDSESYITYLVGDYSKDNFNTPDNYPESLIGLKDGEKDKSVSTDVNDQGIPYPIDNFKGNQAP